MADDLSDLSDMSGLVNQPARTPTPRPTRPGDRSPPPPAGTASVRVAGGPQGQRQPGGSGCAVGMVLLGALVALAVVGLALGLVLSAADDGTPDGEPVVETTAAGDGILAPPEAPRSPGLFEDGLGAAYADLLAAAGRPSEVLGLAVYDGYAFLAYRDPAVPGNIDRRMWRDGEVGPADPNPIDDRADESTVPALFSPDELDPAVVATVVGEAPSHFDMPVEVTHVVVDRFLPFDERVLIRVYASPVDGRSGGGYVSYDTGGAFVDVCC